MAYKVAILRGGPSSEYEVSLRTGKAVFNALAEAHKVIDIIIDQTGRWYKDGIEVQPATVLRGVDVVFNAMHGEYGEDGKVQQILESINARFTGPGSLAAALAMHKVRAKEVYQAHGIKTPHFCVATKTEDIEIQARDVIKQLSLPVIVKPIDKGSSVGIGLAHSFHELIEAFDALYRYTDTILVEEYISGKEATVGVIEQFRNQEIYPLLPTEIITPTHKAFFDYECKYDGSTRYVCPGTFTRTESEAMQKAAITAHRALGLRHYSRTDFMVHPKRGVFILETNALPGLTNESLLPKSLAPIGSSYKAFLEHVLKLAFEQK
jgi:D-alanine-D-alanine ligase